MCGHRAAFYAPAPCKNGGGLVDVVEVTQDEVAPVKKSVAKKPATKKPAVKKVAAKKATPKKAGAKKGKKTASK